MVFSYQIFSVTDTEHFVPAKFPQLEASIQKLVEKLAGEPVIKIEMVLSFVRDHRINSEQVKNYPKLADLIATRSLPLQMMEALFEAGRNNSVFKTELEEHIKNSLNHVIPPGK
jgi:hypothetical protein